MKLNSTVALTLILLAVMIAAGVVSTAWGYALGREALKGITQPDVRPNGLGEPGSNAQPREGVDFKKESDIIEQVKSRMQANNGFNPQNLTRHLVQPTAHEVKPLLQGSMASLSELDSQTLSLRHRHIFQG